MPDFKGEGDGDDEQIRVDLTRIQPHVEQALQAFQLLVDAFRGDPRLDSALKRSASW